MPLLVTRQRRAMNVGTNAALRDDAAVFSGAAAASRQMAEYAGPSPKTIAGEAAGRRHEDGGGTEADVFTVEGARVPRTFVPLLILNWGSPDMLLGISRGG